MFFFKKDFSMRLIWVLYFIFSFSIINVGQAKTDPLGERMVVEINGKSFSQRQVELFFLVRESLQEKIDVSRATINEAEWPQALDFFVNEMTLALEADRVGSSAISQDQFEKLKERSKAQMGVHRVLAQRSRSLQVSQQHIDSMILTIIKIETLRSFKRQTFPSKTSDDQRGESHRQPESWITDIYSRSSIRYYLGARDYKKIYTD